VTRITLMIIAGILVGVAGNCPAADDPTSYRILLDRPSRKGDKAPLEVVFARLTTTTTTWSGHDPSTTEESVGGHLLSDTEVKAVDEHGVTTAEEFTVRKCTTLKGDKESELLAPGAKLLARIKGRGTEFLVDEAAAEPAVRDVFANLISLDRSEAAANLDAVFGSAASRKLGESWPVDATRAIADLRESGMVVDPKDFSGSVTAKSLESANGQPCVRVEAETAVKHLKSQDAAPQSEMVLKDASTHSHMTWLSPIDAGKDVPVVVSEMTIEYTWTGQRGGSTYEVVQTQRSEIHWRIPDK
jgi:hypothetical protein